jgi:hypothetical protein
MYDVVVGLPRKVRLPADVPAYTRYPVAPLTLFHETAMVVSVWVVDAKPVGTAGLLWFVVTVIEADFSPSPASFTADTAT